MLVRSSVASLALLATACFSANALQSPLEVAGEHTLRSIETSFETLSVDALQGGISNTDDWGNFDNLPLTGAIMTDGGTRSLVISKWWDTDIRDDHSFFASTTNQKKIGTVLLFIVEEDGLLLQAVENRAEDGVGNGHFLSVHRGFSTDDKVYEGFVRICAHTDEVKAAIWELTTVDNKQYLQIKANRDSTAKDTVGSYLAVPPDSTRDQYSNYLAVTPDIEKAMAITVEARFHA